MLSFEEVQRLVPKKQKNIVTKELVQKINDVARDPLLAIEFKENFVTYANVLQDGKYSMKEYKSAVHFVTCKLLGDTDISAYAKVFPERYQRLVDNGLDRSKISPYVSAYRKNKLVGVLMEQSLIKPHIYNAHMYQDALDVQADLMMNARSEMVKSVAATAILTQLKPPEAAKLEVEVGIRKDSIVDDYEQVMRRLAQKKKEMIEHGGDVKMIANFDLAEEAEIIEEEE